MEEALKILLPRIVRPGINLKYIQFGDKGNLLRELPNRLRGYRQWLPETAKIIVLIDRDDDDCRMLKQQLEGFAQQAGFTTKSAPHQNGNFQVINRIAIEELEAWFFGDWRAVQTAYPKMPNLSGKAPYRRPDSITGGTWEALERELQKRGYFSSGLRKRELARTVAKHMQPSRNTSPSFTCFQNALTRL
ncbi:DUF4276 family protein [Castellaniella daejeonensis]|uniref:DUF4276 family protein n=2 Tax=Castellaniella daejeonensis TaxID=659013 RepID=A0ABP3D824_9BURK